MVKGSFGINLLVFVLTVMVEHLLGLFVDEFVEHEGDDGADERNGAVKPDPLGSIASVISAQIANNEAEGDVVSTLCDGKISVFVSILVTVLLRP